MVLLYTDYLETNECIPFLKRILRQPVTLKTVITQDIKEQRNVGVSLLLGNSSNRTMILAISKKNDKLFQLETHTENKNDEISSK